MKRIKISVGICAFNEEVSIKKTLLSILAQKETNYQLIEIIIISDGSTDNTVQSVKTIFDKRIKIINGKKRLGKTQRLNYVFRSAVGDVIVLFDADVVLISKNIISKLIKPFLVNKKIGYVGGRMKPFPSNTFIEKSVNISRETFDNIRLHLRNGNSVYASTGCMYALSKRFARETIFPKSVWADNAYLYFSCISKGYEFKSVKNAVIYFKSPSNIKDHLNQMKRYVSESITLEKKFGNLIINEYFIPKHMLYKYKFYSFVQHPFHCLAISSINFYAKHLVKREIHQSSRWTVSYSTKGQN